MRMTVRNKYRVQWWDQPVVLLWVLFLLGGKACDPGSASGRELFEPENLIAWCIVPFDAAERTPPERAAMLRELGLKHFAYDYRDVHIPRFRDEIECLKEQGIALDAVWLWVDPGWDETLNGAGRQILDVLRKSGTRTEIWLGLPEHAFEGIPDEESLSAAVGLVKEILEECEKIGCKLALYNHGGWFGEPRNLVRIIETVGSKRIRIVYNFHHAHGQMEDFQENLDLMLPYLSTININGMRADGPKILSLGAGDRELGMLRIIAGSGFSGLIGILGHTEGEDIRPVLERNLQGLEELKKQL